jgi:hypothetical protein
MAFTGGIQQVSSRAMPVYAASGQPALLVNLDLVNTIYVGADSSTGANSPQIPPLGSLAMDGTQALWATCPTATAKLQVIPGGISWSPSAQQIAEQIALTGIAVNVNGLTVYTPSTDPTGGTDPGKINSLLLSYGSVLLAPGLYYFNSPITMNANGMQIWGSPGAVLIPTAAMTAMIETSAINLRVSGIQIYGGTNTTASNPACDAIEVLPGTLRCIIEDIYVLYMNGAVLNSVPTGALHLDVRSVKSTNCNKGISIVASGPSSVAAQVVLDAVDMQALQTSAALTLGFVTDIAVSKVNAATISAATQPAMSIIDGCQTMFFDHLDLSGGSLTQPVLQITDSGSGSTEIEFDSCTFQNGSTGVAVSNSASRIAFGKCWAKRAQGDGWAWSGTGAFNTMKDCGGNLNNQGGGGGYDVDVFGTVHVLNDGFRYVSGGVTAGRFLTNTNHYTEANAPSSMTNAGFAPNGW